MSNKKALEFVKYCKDEKYTTKNKKQANIRSLPGGDKSLRELSNLYLADDDAYNNFLKKYNNAIKTDGLKFNLMEIPRKDNNIIRIDLDFKIIDKDAESCTEIKMEYIDHIYKKSDIKTFLNIYCNELSKLIEVKNKNYCFTVMEKSKAKKIDNEIKDGVHIMCPDACIDNNILLEARTRTVKNPEFQTLLNKMGLTNYPEDVFDKAPIITNGWFLLNSGKPGDEIYKPSVTYKVNIKEGELKLKSTTLDINEDDLVLHFSNYNKTENVQYKVDKSLIDEFKTTIDEDIKCPKCSFKINDCKCKKKDITQETIENVRKLVNCLHVSRADEYQKWCTIGMILFNISNGDELFNIYNNFSKRSSKYDETAVKRKWYVEFPNTSKKYNLGLPQLRKYAKMDDPVKALGLLDEQNSKYIKSFIYDLKRNYLNPKNKQIKVPDATFAKFISKYIKEHSDMLVICTDVKKNIWYKFENHRWQKDEDSNKLYMFLTNEMIKLIRKYKIGVELKINDLNRNLQTNTKENTMDSEEIDTLDNRIERLENEVNICNKIIERLEENSGRSKLIKDLCNECCDTGFVANLDNNPNVFVTKDCVLAFEISQDGKYSFEVRDGRPEDMVSYYCNMELKRYFKNEAKKTIDYYEIVEEIEDYFDKTFPIIEVKEYFLNIIAESLFGIIRREEFFVWSSPNTNGGGGKSQMQEFLQLVLNGYGNNQIGYYLDVDSKIFSENKSDPNAPNPAIMATKGKRLVIGNEIDANKPLDTNNIKDKAGKGYEKGRNLNENSQTFKRQCKYMLACNQIPNVDQTGEAFWRRFTFLPFVSKFVDENDDKLQNPDKYEYHFERDYEIDEKMKKWAPYALIMFWNRYKDIANKNFEFAKYKPALVIKQSEEYRENSSPIEKFIKEIIVKTNDYITLSSTVRQVFQRYMLFTDKNANNKKQLEKELFSVLKSEFAGEQSYIVNRDGFIEDIMGKGRRNTKCFVGFKINEDKMKEIEQYDDGSSN